MDERSGLGNDHVMQARGHGSGEGRIVDVQVEVVDFDLVGERRKQGLDQGGIGRRVVEWLPLAGDCRDAPARDEQGNRPGGDVQLGGQFGRASCRERVLVTV